MSWYYASGGKQEGPVTDEAFDALVANGTITPLTLVWRQGMAEWKPLKEVRPVATGAAQAGVIPPLVPPVDASRPGTFPPADVPEVEVRSRDYMLDISECFSRSLELLKANPGSIIGASVLVYLCIFGISSVPYLGPIIGLVLTGPLMGGLWNYYIAEHRGTPLKPSDAFGGFGPRFLDLFLGHAVPTVLAGLVMLPMIAVIIGGVFFMSKVEEGGGNLGAMAGVVIALGGILAIVSTAAAVYLQTSWMFTLPLVMNKGMGFWQAMSLSRAVVGKHFWLLLLLTILAGLLATAGVLLCCVGVVFTGPLAFGAVVAAYERALGDLAPSLPAGSRG